MKELDFEHMKKVLDKSNEISPIRTPVNEKPLNDLIEHDFSYGKHMAHLIDQDIIQDTESMSHRLISGNDLENLKNVELILSERKKLSDAVTSLRTKIDEIDDQVRKLRIERDVCENIISMLHNYEKFLITI